MSEDAVTVELMQEPSPIGTGFARRSSAGEIKVRLRALLVLLSALCLALPVFAADEPAGMVMALSGSTTPPVAAMSEIPAGTPLQLAPGTELTFLHYSKCKLVTVSSGTLTVTRTDFSADGKIVDEKDGPCPRVHQLRGNTSGMVSGGLVMRGPGSTPRWPLNRELIIAGAGTDKLGSAAIYAEGRLDAPLMRLEVSGHQA